MLWPLPARKDGFDPRAGRGPGRFTSRFGKIEETRADDWSGSRTESPRHSITKPVPEAIVLPAT